ncbi:MAG TPA: hypothetical protein VGO00_26760 [Kofleriaceae bacterium]|nr:hypothetical protein [Kofleriaceae bacterium]
MKPQGDGMKKSIKTPSKLHLSIDTLRVLAGRQLEKVAGGSAGGNACLHKSDATMNCCPTTITH